MDHHQDITILVTTITTLLNKCHHSTIIIQMITIITIAEEKELHTTAEYRTGTIHTVEADRHHEEIIAEEVSIIIEAEDQDMEVAVHHHTMDQCRIMVETIEEIWEGNHHHQVNGNSLITFGSIYSCRL